MATQSIPAWRIPMDGGAWRATDHGVTKSRARLSNTDNHSSFFLVNLPFPLIIKADAQCLFDNPQKTIAVA